MACLLRIYLSLDMLRLTVSCILYTAGMSKTLMSFDDSLDLD